VAVVAVLAFLLLGGGGGDDEPAAAATTTEAPATTSAPNDSTASTEPTTKPSAAVSGDLDLPRTVQFAGLVITVNAIETDEGDDFTPPSLRLRAMVRNPYETTVVYLTPLIVELQVDGLTLRGTAAGGPGFVGAGQDAPAEYLFELREPDAELPELAGAVLRVWNAGDEPLEIPLDGVAPAETPSASFTPPAEVAVEPRNLVFAFDEASVTRDMPIDYTGNVDTTTMRAAEGSGFVRLHGTVTARCFVGCPGGVLASSGVALLVVDGSSTPPVALTFNEVLVEGQRLEVEIAFEVPLGASTYVLRFDAGSGVFVDTPIDLPALDA
jgi:hypothetical protein